MHTIRQVSFAGVALVLWSAATCGTPGATAADAAVAEAAAPVARQLGRLRIGESAVDGCTVTLRSKTRGDVKDALYDASGNHPADWPAHHGSALPIDLRRIDPANIGMTCEGYACKVSPRNGHPAIEFVAASSAFGWTGERPGWTLRIVFDGVGQQVDADGATWESRVEQAFERLAVACHAPR
jgi:hypothetical protein